MPDVKAKSSIILYEADDTASKAELIWRIGLPISAALLSILAIPLSVANPRASRSMNLFVAILVYLVYTNVLNMMQAWIGKGIVTPTFGVLSVHSIMCLTIVSLFYLRKPLNRKSILGGFVR